MLQFTRIGGTSALNAMCLVNVQRGSCDVRALGLADRMMQLMIFGGAVSRGAGSSPSASFALGGFFADGRSAWVSVFVLVFSFAFAVFTLRDLLCLLRLNKTYSNSEP